MSSFLPLLAVLASLAVLGVLLAGVWNLGRMQPNAELSQRLMRWRVGMQLVAVVIIVLALLAMR